DIVIGVKLNRRRTIPLYYSFDSSVSNIYVITREKIYQGVSVLTNYGRYCTWIDIDIVIGVKLNRRRTIPLYYSFDSAVSNIYVIIRLKINQGVSIFINYS
ncbi:unnamed protein product, partial [marine sediment metagenome]